MQRQEHHRTLPSVVRDALEHPVPRLSPDYVSVNMKELLGGGRSIPFSLTIVTSESSLKVVREEQTTGSF